MQVCVVKAIEIKETYLSFADATVAVFLQNCLNSLPL